MHAYQGSIIPGQVELSPNITLRFKVLEIGVIPSSLSFIS